MNTSAQFGTEPNLVTEDAVHEKYLLRIKEIKAGMQEKVIEFEGRLQRIVHGIEAHEEDSADIQTKFKEAEALLNAELDEAANEIQVEREAILAYHRSNKLKALKRRFQLDLRANYVFAEILCYAFVEKILNIKSCNITRDTTTFATPWGLRRIDAYVVDKKIAIESKVGYQYLTQRLRKQIKKDAYLLKSDSLSAAYWLIYTGCSNNLQRELERNGITVVKDWVTEEILQLFGNVMSEPFFIQEYFSNPALKRDALKRAP